MTAPISPEQWREEVRRRLDRLRPDCYHDLSWAEPVIDWATENLPPPLLRQILDTLGEGEP